MALEIPNRARSSRQFYRELLPRSLRPRQRRAEAVAQQGGVEIAPERGRLGRLDAQAHEGRAVALAQKERAAGDIGRDGDRARMFDPAAHRDLFQIDAETGVALLPAGLSVVTVVDAEDREIGRVHDRDGGERADIHEEL